MKQMNILTLKRQIRAVRYKLSWLYNSALAVENISILRCIDTQGVQKHANRKTFSFLFFPYSFFAAISPRAGRAQPVLEWLCWRDFESSHCPPSSCEPVKSPPT